jgi:hypothetical protein
MNSIVKAEQREISATQNQVAVGPMANAIAALQAGMTIESLRGIMDLQKEWEANEARKAYVADMAAFKLNPPEIYKSKQVAFQGTSYMHATIGDVARGTVDALARHGFSHSWETRQHDGVITVSCKITHRLGHTESTSMQAPPDISGKKNSIQAIASAQTYLQRYTLLAACGLATMDLPDDDGQGYDVDQGTGEIHPPVRATYQPPSGPATLPPYPEDKFAENLPTWRGLIESGKKTANMVIATVSSRAQLSDKQIHTIKSTQQ